MKLQLLSDFLLWCTIINYAVLFLWFSVFALARDWLFGLHGRWFSLSANQLLALHYGGMGVYKIGVLLLNLVPYIALRWVVGHAS
jgi:hypothetical protein